MDALAALLTEFWEWTGIPRDKWDTVDYTNYGIDPVLFPKIGELCEICIGLINAQLTSGEMNMFLTALAIDSEDEDILDACKMYAEDDFIASLVQQGIHHPQSDARWQLAELLRRQIPQRAYFLQQLQSDSNEYVRRRAHEDSM